MQDIFKLVENKKFDGSMCSGHGIRLCCGTKAKKTLFDRNIARYYKGIKKLFNPIWFTD